MSGNKARAKQESAQNIERHIELVQPRNSNPTDGAVEKEKIREKIKVRAAGRKAMAEQQLKGKNGGGKGKKESRLIPADGGMGMGMQVE